MTDSRFDFKNFAHVRRNLIEERLAQYLADGKPEVLWEAMRYSVLGQGKRIRALLCMAGAETVFDSHSTDLKSGVTAQELVLPCCCAIEMVHAMSLIHDDLPCLDNDDLRRGKPTNHKVYGEAMALLAGDALLILANEVLIDKTPQTVPPMVLLSVVRELARATGAEGMVGGQVSDYETGGIGRNGKAAKRDAAEEEATIIAGADLIGSRGERSVYTAEEERVPSRRSAYELNSSNITESDMSTLENIHRGKTGALMRFSLWSGARLAGGNEQELKSLSRFGEIVGLIFQIKDDLLDVTADKNILGKTPGKDEALNKLTWVRLFGLDGSRQKLSELERQGFSVLEESNLALESLPALKELLRYAMHREN